MNRAAFYDSLRPHVNLTTQNVAGTEKVLNYGILRATPINRLAYIVATAWWETAQTMTPVREAYWKDEDWRRRNLRYYPWYGRGLIQTTWEDNYRKMSPIVGIDLTKNPDKLLEWDYALPALFVGMEKGLYTGTDLDDHIDEIDEPDDEDLREYKNARRIVNGTDKAATIATLALRFENALKAGGYRVGATEPSRPTPVPTKPDPVPTSPTAPIPAPEGIVATIGLTIGAIGAWFGDNSWWMVIGGGAAVAAVIGVRFWRGWSRREKEPKR